MLIGILKPPAIEQLLAIMQLIFAVALLAWSCHLVFVSLHHRIKRLRARSRPTVRDLIVWSFDLSTSSGQLQKSYDWVIAQWAALANTIATAALGFFATGVLALYKPEIKEPGFGRLIIADFLASLILYLYCRFRIDRLRREFLNMYSAVLRLSR